MIPGEPTLEPEDMYDKWNNPNKPGKKNLKKNPWNAPGSAPVLGEGCGVDGGNGNHKCNLGPDGLPLPGGTYISKIICFIKLQIDHMHTSNM